MEKEKKEEINNIYANIISYWQMNKLKLRNYKSCFHYCKSSKNWRYICITILPFFDLFFREWTKRTWASQCKIELAQTEWSNDKIEAHMIGHFLFFQSFSSTELEATTVTTKHTWLAGMFSSWHMKSKWTYFIWQCTQC